MYILVCAEKEPRSSILPPERFLVQDTPKKCSCCPGLAPPDHAAVFRGKGRKERGAEKDRERKWVERKDREKETRNSSGDEIANVNFLYDDIVHAVKIP